MFSGNGSLGTILSNIEVEIFIVCLCLATLRPLFTQVKEKMLSTQNTGSRALIFFGGSDRQMSGQTTLGTNRERSKDDS
jgi:hypothetical protein